MSADGPEAGQSRSSYLQRLHTSYLRPQGIRANILHPTHGHQPFRPLPAPTGAPPYRLSLDTILPTGIAAIRSANRLVFHLAGDTGGVMNPVPQQHVAAAMVQDLQGAAATRPAFFYHVGDVVYFYGVSTEYYPQFYEPYSAYEAPIVAIPGNHDGDIDPTLPVGSVPSLQAFVNNFCQPIPRHSPDAIDDHRYTQVLPNVYWTLQTPLATIIGLYTNVPDGGQLDPDQIAWFESELQDADPNLPVLVAMHHPIYSIDDHHSGSKYMAQILADVTQRAGRLPDAVFAGHVHNYQRFTHRESGRDIPFIVAGAGGYHNLHHVSRGIEGERLPFSVPDLPNVTLDAYADRQYGYLRLELTPGTLTGTYVAVSGYGDPNQPPARQDVDTFTLDLRQHAITAGKSGIATGP